MRIRWAGEHRLVSTQELNMKMMKSIEDNDSISIMWGEDGRLDLRFMSVFFEHECGIVVSEDRARRIREMVEERGMRHDPKDMVAVRIDEVSGWSPTPLLYKWIDERVNEWRRNRGYVTRIDGVEKLRILISEEFGKIERGSVRELSAMMNAVKALFE